jgi:hypothetical protein
MSVVATNSVKPSYNDVAHLTLILWAHSLMLLCESRSCIRLCMSWVLSAKLTDKHLSNDILIYSWSTTCIYALFVTRFAWWWQDLHAIELLRAHIGEWTMTRMLDYWRVMCFTSYRLNWNPWIWIPFPVDSDCTLLCAQFDRTRYSNIASGNNCIVQLCKCVPLHL